MKNWQLGSVSSFLLMLVCLLTHRGLADESSAKRDNKDAATFNLTYEAAIKARGGGYEVSLNLPELPTGRSGKIQLTLFNPTDREIAIKQIQTSCSCLKVTTSATTLPPIDSIPIAISLDIPTTAKKKTIYLQFYLKSSDEHGISVYLTFDIAGLVCFTNSYFSSSVSASAKEHIFRMPALVTRPVQPEKLIFLIDDSLGDLDCRLIELPDGSQFVEGRIEDADEDQRSRAGLITMLDETSGAKGETRCIIEAHRDVIVAPIVLRFARAPDRDDRGESKFQAKALIRVSDAILVFGKDDTAKTAERLPRFEVHTEQGQAAIETTRLSKGIYRAKIAWTENPGGVASDDVHYPPSVALSINTGPKAIKMDLKAVFSGVLGK